MKIISVVGARPQFVKAGIVSRKLRENGVEEILLHTGQHYDFNMSEVFFKDLNIPTPGYYLGIGSDTHGKQTGKMLVEIEKVLYKEKPDIVLVYGDTNSTLAGALAAVKIHIPVAHVEAGLRSFNKKMPEEVNRVLTDHISDLLFAPTDIAVENLKNEGITGGVYKVGDVMFDVALEVMQRVDIDKVLYKYGLKYKDFILVTIHRAENTDNRYCMENIWRALNKIANKGITLIFPMHPRTKKAVKSYGLQVDSPNMKIVEPVSYTDMIALEKSAKLIITDSGGVQKEGYFFGTRCVVARKETEWVELIHNGFNVLTGCDSEKIYKITYDTFISRNNYVDKKQIDSLYGNGDASDKIVAALKGYKL